MYRIIVGYKNVMQLLVTGAVDTGE